MVSLALRLASWLANASPLTEAGRSGSGWVVTRAAARGSLFSPRGGGSLDHSLAEGRMQEIRVAAKLCSSRREGVGELGWRGQHSGAHAAN